MTGGEVVAVRPTWGRGCVGPELLDRLGSAPYCGGCQEVG
jgi:hypothetical protein